MKVRRAIESDIPDMDNAYKNARKYMRTEGNASQWSGEYPNAEDALWDIKNNNAYVVLNDNNDFCGCFALIYGRDKTYSYIEDGAWTDDELPYATIHRIASDGSCGGILHAALEYAFSTINNVRVDTHKDNKTMNRLLISEGFIRCGIIYVEDGSPREAYQKIIY